MEKEKKYRSVREWNEIAQSFDRMKKELEKAMNRIAELENKNKILEEIAEVAEKNSRRLRSKAEKYLKQMTDLEEQKRSALERRDHYLIKAGNLSEDCEKSKTAARKIIDSGILCDPGCCSDDCGCNDLRKAVAEIARRNK